MGGVDLMAKPFLIFELTVRAVTFAARSRLQPPKPVVIELAGAASAADQPRPVTHAVPVSAPAVLVETSAPAWPAPTIAPAAPRPIKVAEWREDSPGTTPGYHAETRRVFDELRATTDPASVMELTGLLYLRIHSAASQAAGAKQSVTTRLCTALEGLLKRLYRNPKLASPSVLNTVSNALDLLENLCQPGIEAKLARSSPVRLLVVDDEPLARRAVVGALQLAFDHPESADDGAGAAALIAQKRYDVIFTDVQMPGMDGFELCAAVRRSALNEHTPVIFITSQNDPEAQARATASGGNDFIGKPFLPVEITVKALTFAWEARLAEILCAPTTEEGFNSVAEEESAEALLSA